MRHKIIVAVSGASGSIYAKLLLDKLLELQNQIDEVGIVMSQNAKEIWKEEVTDQNLDDYPFTFYGTKDFSAPFASGSARFNSMVIIPCSMGTLGRIASGVSDDLISRAADVILKERRNLLLVCRENPLNLIHLNNMKTITEAGGTICPAVPSFYSKPQNIHELCMTVINRVTDLLGLQNESFRWGEA